MKSPYELLGVVEDASDDDIRAAYRKAARRWHPDVCKQRGAAERFRQITEAKDRLLDPEKRKALDFDSKLAALRRELRRHQRPQPRPQPKAVPQPEPPSGLFLNIAGQYARDMKPAEGVLFMFLGAALDRELGTDRVTPPRRS